jgi:hypothetical protein
MHKVKKILVKPEPPESNECCGSGSCCPCVWDYYREQLALWQQQQLAAEQLDSQEAKSADQAK